MPGLLSRLPLGSRLIAGEDGSAPDRVLSIAFSGQADQVAVIKRDGRRVYVCRGQAQLLDAIESEMALNVARAARERIFLHCGVVGWRGRAILIPGHTCHGKTTLVTRFLEAGATYYSDEFALLDDMGRVHPFARPLHIRRQPGSLKQTPVPAEEISGAGQLEKLRSNPL